MILLVLLKKSDGNHKVLLKKINIRKKQSGATATINIPGKKQIFF